MQEKSPRTTGLKRKKQASNHRKDRSPFKRHLSSNTAITEQRVLLKAINSLHQLDQQTEIPFLDGPLVNSHTLQDYILDKPLGRGAEGSVFLAHHIETGNPVAVKIIDKFALNGSLPKCVVAASLDKFRYEKGHRHRSFKRKARKATFDSNYHRGSNIDSNDLNFSIKRAKTEIFVMSRLDHKNVVRLIQAWEDPMRICLIMSYATGGDLFEYIQRKGRPDRRQTWRIFKQLLSAVQHMHSQGFVHRDLKPENVFLTWDRQVLLGDFGFSSHWNSLVRKKETHVVGSMPYVAPEVLLGKPYTGPEIDIWSLGVILYEILCGSLPFEGNTPRRLFKAITTSEPIRRPEFTDIEFDLLSRMLTKDPVKRATVMDIYQHPWLQKKPKKKKKKYFALVAPVNPFDSSDGEEWEEEDEDGEWEEDDSFMGMPKRRHPRWKKKPLSVIIEDSESKEY